MPRLLDPTGTTSSALSRTLPPAVSGGASCPCSASRLVCLRGDDDHFIVHLRHDCECARDFEDVRCCCENECWVVGVHVEGLRDEEARCEGTAGSRVSDGCEDYVPECAEGIER